VQLCSKVCEGVCGCLHCGGCIACGRILGRHAVSSPLPSGFFGHRHLCRKLAQKYPASVQRCTESCLKTGLFLISITVWHIVIVHQAAVPFSNLWSAFVLHAMCCCQAGGLLYCAGGMATPWTTTRMLLGSPFQGHSARGCEVYPI